MSLYEIQETIKKHITIIKKTIIKPLNFDIILKVPKKNGKKEEAQNKNQKVRA